MTAVLVVIGDAALRHDARAEAWLRETLRDLLAAPPRNHVVVTRGEPGAEAWAYDVAMDANLRVRTYGTFGAVCDHTRCAWASVSEWCWPPYEGAPPGWDRAGWSTMRDDAMIATLRRRAAEGHAVVVMAVTAASRPDPSVMRAAGRARDAGLWTETLLCPSEGAP